MALNAGLCFLRSLDISHPSLAATAAFILGAGLSLAYLSSFQGPPHYSAPVVHFVSALDTPNRGHNSLACFTVDTATGEIAANGIVDAEPIPNALAVGPDKQFLYSAGQESGNMAIFGIDAGSGHLTRVATIPLGNRPAWISIVQLP